MVFVLIAGKFRTVKLVILPFLSRMKQRKIYISAGRGIFRNSYSSPLLKVLVIHMQTDSFDFPSILFDPAFPSNEKQKRPPHGDL
jgi:hypothetical protein